MPSPRESDAQGVPQRQRRSVENWAYDLLGHRDHPDDMTSPPMNDRKFYWGRLHAVCPADHVAAQTEDGRDLWLGYADEWRFHMPLGVARRLAVWVLAYWVRDLFGLRTWAWFRLLSRRCDRTRTNGPIA